MLRTVGDQPSLWEALLPPEVLGLSPELARVDELLDDARFFEPFPGPLRSGPGPAVGPDRGLPAVDVPQEPVPARV